MFIQEQQKAYTIRLLCEVMCVQRSGYYRHVKELTQPKVDTDLRLLIEVKALDKLSRSSYGSRQMAKNLQAKGYGVGRYQARN